MNRLLKSNSKISSVTKFCNPHFNQLRYHPKVILQNNDNHDSTVFDISCRFTSPFYGMKEASLDTWTTLFLIAAIQGIFLGVSLFLHKKGDRRANNMLAVVLLLFGIMMAYYVAFWSGYSKKHLWMNWWTEPFTFLYGPLIYFYLYRLETGRLPAKPAIHFAPAIIQYLFLLPFMFRSIFGPAAWLRDHFFTNGALIGNAILLFTHLQNISLAAYGIAIFLLMRKDQQQLNRYALNEEIVKNSWLKKVTWLYLAFTLAVWSYWLLAWSGLIRPEYDYLISFSMTVFIYTVGYLGFHQPEIFGHADFSRKLPETKYARSSLKTDQAGMLLKRLLQIMQDEKPYLDSNLKIQHLAERVGISSHHLSQIINENMNQNYADFINSYRINEARRLLLSPEYEQEKILSVAFDAGFQNKATFNAIFKKYTGMSPSGFKKHQQKVAVN